MLTQEYLKEIFNHHSETGLFSWKIKIAKKTKIGKIAGYPDKNTGYWVVRINKKRYQIHRLVWLWYYGAWPIGDLDHIDQDKLNNVITNLREANESQNNANRNKQINNSSGYKGVIWDKNANKWRAQIKMNNKYKYLGLFGILKLATLAYNEAAKELHGEFACLNEVV
jgi:HNH endonuclease/AP2 domain